MGRIFCGVATSLLFSAFESWLVAEHFKVSQLAEDAVLPECALTGACRRLHGAEPDVA